MRQFIRKLYQQIIARHNHIFVGMDCVVDTKILSNMAPFSKIQNGVKCFGNVKIGQYTSVNGPNTELASKINNIEIGNFCSIAPNVRMQEYFHKIDRVSTYYIFRNVLGSPLDCDIVSKGPILIEDDVWIGSNCVILSGAKIGRGSVVSAGSVVNKTFPRYSIIGGNPAKLIGKRFNDDVIEFLEATKWWTWDAKKIKKNSKMFNLDGSELTRENLISAFHNYD